MQTVSEAAYITIHQPNPTFSFSNWKREQEKLRF
jgi:hypothetical protein